MQITADTTTFTNARGDMSLHSGTGTATSSGIIDAQCAKVGTSGVNGNVDAMLGDSTNGGIGVVCC